MQLPFGTDQFFDVFARYNEAVWPLQLVLFLSATVAAALVLRGGAEGDRSRIVAGILGVLWIWMGAVYHIGFFRTINPVATAFGVAFIAQGAALLWYGVRTRGLVFGAPSGVRGIAGAILLLYALVAYPLLGLMAGHIYPAAPTFGLPCPTTIFTFGMFMWARPNVPLQLLPVPVLWAAIGTVAAVRLGVPQDLGLAAAAVLVLGGTISRRAGRRLTRSRAEA